MNRIVNLLNGTTTNLKTVLKTSDAGDPPLELDQLSTGPILKGFQGGVLKAQISNAGNYLFNQSGGFIGDQNGNEYLKFTTTASAANEIAVTNASAGNRPTIGSSGEANAGLNISPNGTGQVFITGSSPLRLPTGVSPSNDDDAARKKYVDDRIVPWSATWFYSDPSTAAIAEDQAELLVPASATAFIVTHIRIEYRQGSHAAGGSVTFTLRRRGAVSEDIGTISLDDTNNTATTLYTNDVADKTLAASDRIFVFKSATSGTVNERAVSIFVEGTRKVS